MRQVPLSQIGFAQLALLEEMHEKYLQNPEQVPAEWRAIFEGTSDKETLSIKEKERVKPLKAPSKSAIVETIIQAYRTYGHLAAKVSAIAKKEHKWPKQLELSQFGLYDKDLGYVFPTCGLLPEAEAPLKEIIQRLQTIYCGSMGVEFKGFVSPELEAWLEAELESEQFRHPLTIEEKQRLLHHLNKAELFETFLHTKYPGQKRFSLEGSETLIPVLAALIEKSSDLGAISFVIGMAHRGRLNVLSNILGKSYKEVFAEFAEGYIPPSQEGTSDVKYHKGFQSELITQGGSRIEITIAPNPSHLESVDPVVEGMVRAKQVHLGSKDPALAVVPIFVHGDAALSGQGVIYETLQFMRLPGYETGGTLHVVINNEIGFTTIPEEGRSTLYCTDIAKAFGIPVFHVNAEDPEEAFYVANLAAKIRQKFRQDVFIDLYCYRKYGHNEGDEPFFTQPLEYSIIKKKATIREIYRNYLIQHSFLEKVVAETLEAEFKRALQSALSSLETEKNAAIPIKAQEVIPAVAVNTAVSLSLLQKLGERLAKVPSGFHLHPKMEQLLRERLKMVASEEAKPLDWGMAETLAYATLLEEGKEVRISGQDVKRGTFSHRQAVWVDQTTGESYIPLAHLGEKQGRVEIINSPLSEFAVLGFEYGYSMGRKGLLVVWEAQFGDFCNGAQIIIDQYIASAKQKWGKSACLTLLLPHGYEGQGPEHSSARMERFLALTGKDNMQVVVPSTPKQLFHLLRRQVLGNVEIPLIIFTPKAMLRHPACVSSLSSLAKGHFEEVIDEEGETASRVVFCSGKIYFELAEKRKENAHKGIALVRIEQLYPFPKAQVATIMERYAHAKEFIWVQEEPSNMGAWWFIQQELQPLLPKGKQLRYVGRERSASPAVGCYVFHKKESAEIFEAVFGEEKPPEFEAKTRHQMRA